MPICLDEVTIPVAITGCCQNSYCFECILMSMNMSSSKRCPMCKPNCDKTLHYTDDTIMLKKMKKLMKMMKINLNLKLKH